MDLDSIFIGFIGQVIFFILCAVHSLFYRVVKYDISYDELNYFLEKLPSWLAYTIRSFDQNNQTIDKNDQLKSIRFGRYAHLTTYFIICLIFVSEINELNNPLLSFGVLFLQIICLWRAWYFGQAMVTSNV